MPPDLSLLNATPSFGSQFLALRQRDASGPGFVSRSARKPMRSAIFDKDSLLSLRNGQQHRQPLTTGFAPRDIWSFQPESQHESDFEDLILKLVEGDEQSDDTLNEAEDRDEYDAFDEDRDENDDDNMDQPCDEDKDNEHDDNDNDSIHNCDNDVDVDINYGYFDIEPPRAARARYGKRPRLLSAASFQLDAVPTSQLNMTLPLASNGINMAQRKPLRGLWQDSLTETGILCVLPTRRSERVCILDRVANTISEDRTGDDDDVSRKLLASLDTEASRRKRVLAPVESESISGPNNLPEIDEYELDLELRESQGQFKSFGGDVNSNGVQASTAFDGFTNVMNPNLYVMRANIRNGMVISGAMPNADMAKRITPQQLAIMQQQQLRQREGSNVDMNGRPRTPAEGDNGSSPSKRPSLEGKQQFNSGMMANRRPMPTTVPQGMMIQDAFDQLNLNPQFRLNTGMLGQKEPMQPGKAPNGGTNTMNDAGSPTMVGMNNGQFSTEAGMEMYQSGRRSGRIQGGPPVQSRNDALQDYQMQQMLLELQDKERQMMAQSKITESTAKALGY